MAIYMLLCNMLHVRGIFELARILVGAGANVNTIPGWCTRDPALQLAAGAERTELIKVLLANGARVNEPGEWGRCALHEAASAA